MSRLDFAVYRESVGMEPLCSICAAEIHGERAVWNALHHVEVPPLLKAEVVTFALREHPLGECRECGQTFWSRLPLSGTDPAHRP